MPLRDLSRSSRLTPSEAEIQPFPGSIKWSSWKSTKLENVLSICH